MPCNSALNSRGPGCDGVVAFKKSNGSTTVVANFAIPSRSKIGRATLLTSSFDAPEVIKRRRDSSSSGFFARMLVIRAFTRRGTPLVSSAGGPADQS